MARSLPARLALAFALGLGVAACGGGGDPGDGQAATTTTQTQPSGELRVETVATNLEVPWDMTFLPDGSALVTERPGRVRLLSAGGELQDEPVAEVDVQAQGEGGLLGIDLDPEFEDNRFVYLYSTTADGMRVTRHRYEDGALTEDAIVLGDIAAGPIHDSGRLRFGPDDRLYVATGDAGRPELAQDPGSRNGKFLVMTPEQYRGDGGEAQILSSGHRNPQGLDWEPGTDRLVATEHGSTGFDEVNVIREGADYGWPQVRGPDHGRYTAPLTTYEESIAPSGAAFAPEGSAWAGDYVLAALRGQQLRRLTIEGDEVTSDEPLLEDEYGRLRAVVPGPDGALYVLTSNRDGRGDPVDEDDRILRVVPPQG